MEAHKCIMKDQLTKAVESIENWVKWTLAICAGAVLYTVINVSIVGTKQSNLIDKVNKIQEDYAPWETVVDLMENNERFIEVWQAIPEASKNDSRYEEAIKSRNAFQREAIQRASKSKSRSGSAQSFGGSE